VERLNKQNPTLTSVAFVILAALQPIVPGTVQASTFRRRRFSGSAMRKHRGDRYSTPEAIFFKGSP
jgi:hypothetical protein